MTRVEQLRDLETAKQVASLLEAENARLHQRLEALVAENARLKGEDAQARLQWELEGLRAPNKSKDWSHRPRGSSPQT